jgi:hypothetical protein
MVLTIILTVALAIGFFFLQVKVARSLSKALYQREATGRKQVLERGIEARARIADVRLAGVQRPTGATIFKFRLEVFPVDLQPSFSVALVWELEAAAIHSMAIGNLVSVKVNRENLRYRRGFFRAGSRENGKTVSDGQESKNLRRR